MFTGEDVMRFHEVVRKVPIAQDLVRYAVRLAAASRPRQPGTPDFINDWVNWGAGLRASQFLVLGAKVRALLQGRSHVTEEDLRPFRMSRDTGLGLDGDAPPIQVTPRGGLEDPVLPLPTAPPRDPKPPESTTPAFPQPLPGIGSQPLGKLPGTPVAVPPPKKPGGGSSSQ